jgi:DNA-binding transcriptional MerR regulator
MNNEKLLDISAVSSILGISSRTLRFYEEKGLVESTKEFTNRRKYTLEQFELIKKILVLRSLGLSISKIQSIQKGDSDLKQAIIERKAEIIARIVNRSKEIRLLDDALNVLTDGGDIFGENPVSSKPAVQTYHEIVDAAVNEFINGNYEKLFAMCSEMLQEYTPLSALKRVISDTLAPLGNFVSLDKIVADGEIRNVFYCYLRYEKLGLHIRFVLHGEKIHGFWLNYYGV